MAALERTARGHGGASKEHGRALKEHRGSTEGARGRSTKESELTAS